MSADPQTAASLFSIGVHLRLSAAKKVRLKPVRLKRIFMTLGKVIQVAGPAVDVEFPEGQIPVIRTAIRITSEGFNVPDPINIICEVAQHIGESRVRTIALQPTDGLVRGMRAENLDRPVTVPVGRETLGRVLNVIGEPVDNMGPVNTKE